MKSINVQKNEAGMKLDKFLGKFFPGASMGLLYKQLKNKNITLNGKKSTGIERINEGDIIEVFFSDETFEKFRLNNVNKEASFEKKDQKLDEYKKAFSQLKAIKVVFENDNIIILDKPAGILTQKSTSGDVSLNEWLIGYLMNTNKVSLDSLKMFTPSVCNRLDRNTSGLVLCSKTLSGAQYLSNIIADRSVRKFYNSICIGKIDKYMVLEGYIRKDEKTNQVDISKKPKNGYVPIKTVINPLKKSANASLLELELVTGKSHQLRAHLASINHPLLGDTKYGGKCDTNNLAKRYKLKYQLLRAVKVVFPDDDIMHGLEVTAPSDELFEMIEKDLF